MLLKPPTPDQLRATFDRLLAAIGDGTITSCPSDTGLDEQTIAALDAVAAGRVSRDAARSELARMLDGTHARQARQRIEKRRST